MWKHNEVCRISFLYFPILHTKNSKKYWIPTFLTYKASQNQHANILTK